MIPTIENILKALFAGDMDVATASRYIATHIELAERRAALTPTAPTTTLPPVAMVPLTADEVLTEWSRPCYPQDIHIARSFEAGVRFAERHHGIEASTGEQSHG